MTIFRHETIEQARLRKQRWRTRIWSLPMGHVKMVVTEWVYDEFGNPSRLIYRDEKETGRDE